VAFLHAKAETIHDRAVNIGSNEQNYQVKDVADEVARLLPDAEIVFTGEVGEDPRDYRVRFDLLNELLPDFKCEFNLQSGMAELHRQMVDHGFSAADFEGPKYVRLRTLQDRLGMLSAAEA
jgi:nucleoside-diphosphate-sugar epimerase